MSAAVITSPRLTCPTCMSVFLSYLPSCPNDGAKLEVSRQDPLVGKPFADRYIIEGCVGEGGMGRVYRARHQRVSRKFAIKVLFGDFATDKTMRTRFAREAEAASGLDHPNVISVVDFGETPMGQLYLVMDHAEGSTLADIITNTGPMHPDRIAQLTIDMASGLAHAHEQELVHRDFKADNVMVVPKPEGEIARILDFGLAIPQGPDQTSSRLTAHGLVMGTAEYMSPEQAVGHPLDRRTDLFSLGLVVYEMLCGALPFEGSPTEIIKKNLSDPPPPIHLRVPGLQVDPALEQLAFWLMRKKRSERPQSAHDVVAALEARAAGRHASYVGLLPGGDAPSFSGTVPPDIAQTGLEPSMQGNHSMQWSESSHGPPGPAPAPAAMAPAPAPGMMAPGMAPGGMPGGPGVVVAGQPVSHRGPSRMDLRKVAGILVVAAIIAGVTAAALVSSDSEESVAAPAAAQRSSDTGDTAPAHVEANTPDPKTSGEPSKTPSTAVDRKNDENSSKTGPKVPTKRTDKSGNRATARKPSKPSKKKPKPRDTKAEQQFSQLHRKVGARLQGNRDNLGEGLYEELDIEYRKIKLGNVKFDPGKRKKAAKTLRQINKKLDRHLGKRRPRPAPPRQPPAETQSGSGYDGY